MQPSAADIREKYETEAPSYDWKMTVMETLTGLGRLRRKHLKRAKGTVLIVGIGTGKDVSYLPKDCTLTGIDLSPAMLRIAEERAKSLNLTVSLSTMDAEQLTFPDQSFDTVVSTLALCTYPNPIKALQEMRRVCKQNARILLLEHGRSSSPWLARLQDHNSEKWIQRTACHVNREPLELVREAGLNVLNHKRSFFGILHTIEAS